MLTDDSTDSCSLPTKENMLDGMRWLVKDAQPHDSLFFHCNTAKDWSICSLSFSLLDSGHGGQTEDLDEDEVDGCDEGPLIFA